MRRGAAAEPALECPDARPETLDGLAAPGTIRARGIAGLFSVRGALSFRNGMLVWSEGESEDVGQYSASAAGCLREFSAEHVIERNERVRWSGASDGRTVTGVTAVWTRVKGNLMHDLFLPEQVILDFTPDRPLPPSPTRQAPQAP